MEKYMVKAKHKETGKWFIGYPMKIQNKNMLLLDDEQNLLRVHYIVDEMWDAETYAVEIDEKTICKPTGTTDKNGNKIWENDICNCEKRGAGFFHCIIKYSSVNARFDAKTIDCDFAMTLEECIDDILIKGLDYEVIGNIFDNPELLEVLN